MSKRIAIVGAGFSGVSLACNLYRQAQEPYEIFLIDRNVNFGQGVAYSTPSSVHLLNVPAGKMSAFPDRPDHFAEWLAETPEVQQYLNDKMPIAEQYVPRMVYGLYLKTLLGALAQPSSTGTNVKQIHADVLAIAKDTEEYSLNLSTGDTLTVDKVVLAMGNQTPKDLFPDLDNPNYLRNPWQIAALQQIEPEQAVCIIGAGLTMIDVVLSLREQGHRGLVYAVSRKGVAVQPHRYRLQGRAYQTDELPSDLKGLLRFVRHRITESARDGDDWRAWIDALRPYTQQLWRGFDLQEQQRFLRHLGSHWGAHRHRIAPQVAQAVEEQRQLGRLQHIAGRVQGIAEHNGELYVTVRKRGDENSREQELRVSHVINCTGPNENYQKLNSPLFDSLFQTGLACPHELGTQLAVTDLGAVCNSAGQVSDSLFALGPLCRGQSYEITAVPDIRQQSFLLSAHLLY